MNCMKCGVEIHEDQVFCADCLKLMEAYPVDPGTPVHIPKRPVRSVDKKARELKPQEQIAALKRVIRWMLLTIGVLTVAVALLASLLLYRLNEPKPQPITGRNYTAVTK